MNTLPLLKIVGNILQIMASKDHSQNHCIAERAFDDIDAYYLEFKAIISEVYRNKSASDY